MINVFEDHVTCRSFTSRIVYILKFEDSGNGSVTGTCTCMDYQLRQEACNNIFLVGIHTNLNIITRQQAAITSVSSSLSSSSTSLSSTAPATTTWLSPSSFAGSGLVAPATSSSSSYTTAAASGLSQQQQHRQDLLVELEKNKKK